MHNDLTTRGRWLALLALLAAAAIVMQSTLGAAEATSPTAMTRLFSLVGDYPVGAATSRADYQSFDRTASRLYIAKMGSGKRLAFNIVKDGLLAELDGFLKVNGVLAVPALHRVDADVPGAG